MVHGRGHGGGSHVVPLDRWPPMGLASQDADRLDRKSMEGVTDRSRTTSRDRSRETSREYRGGTSQRPSSESQMEETSRSPLIGGPTHTSLQHTASTLPVSPGRVEAAGRNKRRQVAAGEQGKPLPAIRIINRHTVQVPRGGWGSGKGGRSTARGAGLSPSSASPPASPHGRPSSSRRTNLSAKGKLRAGVHAVEAVTDLSNLLVSRGSSSGGGGGSFGGAAGGTGGGGGIPTVGSPQEEALVVERKDGRERHPGPSLNGIGDRRAASSAILALKTHRKGPSLVSPHICIGAKEDAKDLPTLKELGVTHVLNCAKQLPSSHPKEFVHARLELVDSSDEELVPFQKAGVSFLRQVEGCGGRALVHCIAGCSRSVSIVLLHLMETHRIRLKLAYDHVRSYRMVAQPNEGFRFQLATTEVKLFGSSSVSRDAESIWNFYRWNEVKHGIPYQAVDQSRFCGDCTIA